MKMTEEEFKRQYKDIMEFEREIKSDIKYLKRVSRKLYREADKSGFFKKRYSKMFVRLDDIIFGHIF